MKKTIIVISGCIILAACFAFYQYNKPHKNIHQMNSDFILSSIQLFDSFSNDEAVANQQYLNKVIELRGRVEQIQINESDATILLEGSNDGLGYVNCAINYKEIKKLHDISTGDYIIVKGICSGYLMDVVLNKCVIKN